MWLRSVQFAILSVAMSALCRAEVIITVTPTPSARSIVEGNWSDFTFKIQNKSTMLETVRIDSVRLVNGKSDDSIAFQDGDRRDKVIATALQLPSWWSAPTDLGAGGWLDFTQKFWTADYDKDNSDTNSGIWKISNEVTWTYNGIQQTSKGFAVVEVRDPGASQTVPEPATVGQIALGILSLAIVARLRRAAEQRVKQG
jgi:hypothetical protein